MAVALADDYDGDPDGFDFNFILGYIPRTCNSAIAAILDTGHGDIIEAEISEMNERAPYPERLHITVYVKAKPLPTYTIRQQTALPAGRRYRPISKCCAAIWPAQHLLHFTP